MNFPLSISPSKEMEIAQGKKKISDLDGNQTHDLELDLIACCSTDWAMRPDGGKSWVIMMVIAAKFIWWFRWVIFRPDSSQSIWFFELAALHQ